MIDLVGKRYWYLAASLLIIIPGLIAILTGGLKQGIDFTGGTRLTLVPMKAAAGHTDEFVTALGKVGYGDAAVRSGTVGTAPNITNTITLDVPRIASLPYDQAQSERSRIAGELINEQLVAGGLITSTIATTNTVSLTPTAITGTSTVTTTAIVTATGVTTGTTGTTGSTGPTNEQVSRWQFAPTSVIDDYTVGPTVGQELIGRAFLAILAASAAILLYLTIVFRRVPNAARYGVCAIVALLHDVLVVTGIFAILGFLFGVEIDSLFITAMLTVIGFSVHDTIVVFDRVRENIGRRRFERFQDVVNYSLVQTLARSINTSITVLLTLFALYLFGGESIRNFVLALLIGILSGTYSSIFNASMLLVVWENREWKRGNRTQPPAAGPRSVAAR